MPPASGNNPRIFRIVPPEKTGRPDSPRRSGSASAWLPGGIAALLALAAVAFFSVWRQADAPVQRFEIRMPVGQADMFNPRLSPDGSKLLFETADSSGLVRAWVRPLDSFDAVPIPGTEGVRGIFWSPDGRETVLIIGGKLMKSHLDGGGMTQLCNAPSAQFASWGRGGTLVFDGGADGAIEAVSTDGGEPRVVARPDVAAGEGSLGWPAFLPDGKHFLYVAQRRDSHGIAWLKLGCLGSPVAQRLGPTTGRAEYLADDWVLYARGRRMMAQELDPGRGVFTGAPIPLAQQLREDFHMPGHFSVSSKGLLAYCEKPGGTLAEVRWYGRDGRDLGEVMPSSPASDFALSPDGRRLAYELLDPTSGLSNIWVRDLVKGSDTQVTWHNASVYSPNWSPDGARIAYAAGRDAGEPRVLLTAADGTGGVDTLAHRAGNREVPQQWLASGQGILVVTSGARTGADLEIQPLNPGQPFHQVVSGPAAEHHGQVSPDGRRLTYVSAITGIPEVYVAPWGFGGTPVQVSQGGGNAPQWTLGGKELVYETLDRWIVAVPVPGEGAPRVGEPKKLFRLPEFPAIRNSWTVTADGARFIVSRPAPGELAHAVRVVTNLPRELVRRSRQETPVAGGTLSR